MKEEYVIKNNIDNLEKGKSTLFLDSKKQKLLKSKYKKEYQIFSPYKDSEKVIFYKNTKPKITLLEIICINELKHSDILGVMFSLNINENYFGDIVIKDNRYFIYIFDHLKEYLISNLKSIKNNNVEIKEVNINYLENYERKYEVIEFVSTSERLDKIVSTLTHINREKIKEKIKNKEIFVNYEIKNSTYILKENDILSIRKFGKYKYIGVKNKTKNNNLIINVLKYQ